MSCEVKFKVLIIIIFLSNLFISNSCEKGSNEKTESKIGKNIHVVFYMNPGRVEYKGSKKIPVFKYDPRDDIERSLKKAGFGVEKFLIIAEGESTSSPSLKAYSEKIKTGDYRPYDLKLMVTYVERVRSTSPYPRVLGRTETEIATVGFSFILYDDKGQRLLDEQSDPSGRAPGTTTADAHVKFCEGIPQLILDRLKAEDEVSFLISRIQKEDFLELLKRGGGLVLIRELERLQDPRAINAILPFLRSEDPYVRWRVKYTLFSLGYLPKSVEEKAIWEIIDLTEPKGLTHKEIEAIPWGVRRESIGPDGSVWHGVPLKGRDFIAYYGLPGIKLLIEDLRQGYSNEKKYLCLLTKENWKKEWEPRGSVTTVSFSPEKITYLSDAEVNKKLMSKMKKPYRRAKGRGSIDRKHIISLFRQEWNDYATDSLIAALKDEGCKGRYLSDVIYILGEISDKRAIDALNLCVSKFGFGGQAKRAIQKIESRGK